MYFSNFDNITNKIKYKEMIHQMVISQMKENEVYDKAAMVELMSTIERGYMKQNRDEHDEGNVSDPT